MSNPTGIIKRSNSYFADPAAIVRKAGWNPRFDFGDLSELKQSIRANGFMASKPILVRRNEQDALEIVDGDRRFTAVEALIKEGMDFSEGIPVVIENRKISDLEALVHTLTANNGKNLLPLEEAGAYKRMLDSGLKPKEIAARLGKSEANVKWTLGLLEADDSVKTAVKEGKISGSLAKDVAMKAKGDKEKQKALVAKATSSKKGKTEVKKEVAQIKRRPSKKDAQQGIVSDPKLKALSPERLSELELRTIGKMADCIKALGLTEDSIKPFLQQSDETAAAFYIGALFALRVAQGHDIKLEV